MPEKRAREDDGQGKSPDSHSEHDESDEENSEVGSDDSDYLEVLGTIGERSQREGGLDAVARAMLLNSSCSEGDTLHGRSSKNKNESLASYRDDIAEDEEKGDVIESLVFGHDGQLKMNLPELSKLLTYLSRLQQRRGLRKRLFDRDAGLHTVVRAINRAERILVLSGAGVSVSCGIPDFRSRGGLYDTVRERFGMDEPQSLFDIEYFKIDPAPFFAFAKEIMPTGSVEPSVTHRFIRELELRGKLLRNFSQNIDGLERVAGIERHISCHGSFATATCRLCKRQVDGNAIRNDVLKGVLPQCTACLAKRASDNKDSASNDDESEEEDPILKPDIVFFGEKLPEEFFSHINRDIQEADLLLVIGTSLKVAPVAKVPQCMDPSVPQLLFNREPLHRSNVFDLELLGNCDIIAQEVLRLLKWSDGYPNSSVSCEKVLPYRMEIKDLTGSERSPSNG